MQRRILLAATKVVALKGIENASVTEIAKKARITRSLIQYYLPKQDRLMVELVGFMANEGYHYFIAQDASVKCRFDLPEALEKRIRLNFKFFSEYPHYFQCFMLFFYRASYDDECRKLNTAIVNRAVSVMRQSVSSDAVAEQVYFGMHAAIQRCFVLEKRVSLEEAVTRFLKETENLLA